MATSNVNLQPGYWDQIWEKEGTATWRRYPGCFGRICWAVGHFNEVLELGCGTGLLARQLLEFGNAVTGLDISAAAIAQLPSEIKGVVATLPSIPLPDDSFDVVVATETLEHIEDDQACVRETVRVLRSGGAPTSLFHIIVWDPMKTLNICGNILQRRSRLSFHPMVTFLLKLS